MIGRVMAIATTITFAAAPIACSHLPGHTSPPRSLVFTHVAVIDMTGAPATHDMTVVVVGDRITGLGTSGTLAIPAGATIIDARGKYLIPGLIDTHVHLAWDLDARFTLTTAEQLRLLYLPNGITTVREASTRGLEAQTIRARDEAPTTGTIIPRIYVSGRIDAQRMKEAGLNAGQLTANLIDRGVDAIKIRHGLSLHDIREIVAEAGKAEIQVWGHTYGREGDFTADAVSLGINGITHVLGIPPLGSGTRPADPPDDSATWQSLWIREATRWLDTNDRAVDSLISSMIRHDVWLEPTLITEKLVVDADFFRGRPSLRYAVIPFEQLREGFPSPTGEDLRRYTAAFQRMKEFVRRFHDAGGLVIAGTDGLPYPGFGIHDELQLLVDAGLPPMATLQAATRNASRALGWEDTLGTVEIGKQADLVLLDANPLEHIGNTRKIHAVLTRGRYLSRGALDDLLSAADERAVAKRDRRQP